MTKLLRVCLATSGLLPVLAFGHRADAVSTPSLAWDESSASNVKGYALHRRRRQKRPWPDADVEHRRVRLHAATAVFRWTPHARGQCVQRERRGGVESMTDRSGCQSRRPVHSAQVGSAITVDGERIESSRRHDRRLRVELGRRFEIVHAHVAKSVAHVQRRRHRADHADRHRQRRRHSIGDDHGHDLDDARDAVGRHGRPLGRQYAAREHPLRVESSQRLVRGRRCRAVESRCRRTEDRASARQTERHFEQTFQASAGTAYHLWIRMRAQNNSFGNDSIHVQFNDSLNSARQSGFRIGTTDSAEVVLQNGSRGPALRRLGMVRQRVGFARRRHLLHIIWRAHYPHPGARRRRGRRSDCLESRART